MGIRTGRKFWSSIGVQIVNTFLVIGGVITPEIYQTLTIFLSAGYIVSNVGSKYVERINI